MKITGLSHLFKWENLHNWWLTKYFFAPLYIYFAQLLSSLNLSNVTRQSLNTRLCNMTKIFCVCV